MDEPSKKETIIPNTDVEKTSDALQKLSLEDGQIAKIEQKKDLTERKEEEGGIACKGLPAQSMVVIPENEKVGSDMGKIAEKPVVLLQQVKQPIIIEEKYNVTEAVMAITPKKLPKSERKGSRSSPAQGIRSSPRLQLQQLEEKPKKEDFKEFWYVFTTEKAFELAMEGIVVNRNKGIHNAELLKKDSTKKDFKRIGANDKLFIHAHSILSGEKLYRRKNHTVSAEKFAEHLDETLGLNKAHKSIEVLACYGNFFIGDLWVAMCNRGYHYIKIAGYKGQFSPRCPTGGKYGEDFAAGLYREAEYKAAENDSIWKERISINQFNSALYRVEVQNQGDLAGLKKINATEKEHIDAIKKEAKSSKNAVNSYVTVIGHLGGMISTVSGPVEEKTVDLDIVKDIVRVSIVPLVSSDDTIQDMAVQLDIRPCLP